MNHCNTLKTGSAFLAMALVASIATAQVRFNVPANPQVAASKVPRAEVVADYLVWRASGLQELHRRGQQSIDTTTPEYLQATARYRAMRDSPQFAELVDSVRSGGTPAVVVASMSSSGTGR
jgi:hypothetical protein